MLVSMFLLLFLGESVHEQLVLRHVHVHAQEIYAAAAHLMPMLLKEDEEEGCQHMLLISLFIATFQTIIKQQLSARSCPTFLEAVERVEKPQFCDK